MGTVIEPISERNFKIIQNNDLPVRSILDTSVEGRVILNTENWDWIGFAELNKRTRELLRIEVNHKYRGMGYGKRVLYLLPEAEYLFVKNTNTTARLLYDKYWNESILKWYCMSSGKTWNSYVNPRIDPFRFEPSGVFLNIRLKPVLASGYHRLIGRVFERIRYTGKEELDYTASLLKKSIRHSDHGNLELITINNETWYKINEEIRVGEELTINYKKF